MRAAEPMAPGGCFGRAVTDLGGYSTKEMGRRLR